jgi:rare lipoprotein A
VVNLSNNKEVIVKINDRLPRKSKRVIDLSYSAAKQLDFINKGLTKVELKPLL